jgi:hypothetical protein
MRLVPLLLLCSCAWMERQGINYKPPPPRPTALRCPRKDFRVIEVPLGAGFTEEFEGWYLFTGCWTEIVCPTEEAVAGECRDSPPFAAVRERLSIETGCDRNQVRLITVNNWSTGGQLVYRVEACGAAYVCTTQPGRGVECKVPLVAPTQAPPPPPAP